MAESAARQQQRADHKRHCGAPQQLDKEEPRQLLAGPASLIRAEGLFSTNLCGELRKAPCFGSEDRSPLGICCKLVRLNNSVD